MRVSFGIVLLSLLGNGWSLAQDKPQKGIKQTESDFYKINTVQIPKDIELEVGGMVLLPNDVLVVCTRHGEVWMITNPYANGGKAPQYHLFAEGLHEALGINYINGDIYVTQRSELTRLRDTDGDGEADEYKTIYSWPLSGNYHEYAYGPILDKEGNMVVTLNLGWIGKGASLSKWHGWMLKITADGKMKPFAAGFRSPAGFALNSKRRYFLFGEPGRLGRIGKYNPCYGRRFCW